MQEILKHVSFLLNEEAIFDLPKGGLNGLEQFEPYDFLITPPLNFRFPPLTQYGQKNSPNDVMYRTIIAPNYAVQQEIEMRGGRWSW